MSSFSSSSPAKPAGDAPKKKHDNWNIAEEDSGSDDEEQEEENAPAEENNESDSDSDADDNDKLNITPDIAAKPVVPKKKDISQLSKKERLELKQKELAELDAMLNEFGVQPAAADPAPAIESAKASATAEITEEEKSKKKKKKKPTAKKDTNSAAPAAPVEAETASAAPVVVDIASVLKNRSAKKDSKKDAAAEAQAIAKALTANQGSKKKNNKDKSTFSEYSY
jgi:hypothetical protein